MAEKGQVGAILTLGATRLGGLLAVVAGIACCYLPTRLWFSPTYDFYFHLKVAAAGFVPAAICLAVGFSAAAYSSGRLLPLAWGSVLGTRLPTVLLLIPTPHVAPPPIDLHRETIVVTGYPDYGLSVALVVIAMIGLALWLAGEGRRAKPEFSQAE
jgi:hypothetical protein